MQDTALSPVKERSAWLPPVIVAALSLAATLPVILSGSLRGRQAADQINFHEPMIRTFIEQGVGVDFSNYLSATTPLYHLIIARVGAVGLDSTAALRGAGWGFTAVLLGLLAWTCARRTSTLLALAFTLPLAASLYVFGSGAWMLPDNAAWLGVLGVLLIALRPRFDAWTVGAGGFALLLLVLTRQIHLWAAAPLWTAAWLGGTTAHQTQLFAEPGPRFRRGAIMVAATAPAFAAIAYFIWLWGGLVVPRFQGWYTGWSPATAAFQLALFGVFGLFFVHDWLPGLARVWREQRRVVLIGLGIALAAAIIPATSYDMNAGRWSGLWNLVNRLPVFADRSPLILALALGGSATLIGLLWSVSLRERWVLLAALAGFCAAQTASPQLWQRYNEPFVLLVLAVLASRTERPAARTRAIGPMLLGIALAATTYLQISRAAPQERTYDPSTILRLPSSTPAEE